MTPDRSSPASAGSAALLGLLAAFAASSVVAAPLRAVTDFKPKIDRPAYAADGPVVAIDEAHRNFHKLDGRYAPFASLLAADGYRVRSSTKPFSPEALSGVAVLVIANARPPRGSTGSAFGDAEIAAVRQWVESGGSLLLIADHAPFGTAAAALAAAYGVEMGQGYVAVRQQGRVTSRIRFSGEALGRHPILAGRGRGEQVRRVMSFTGQSLGLPPGGTPLLTLPADALEVASDEDIDRLREGASAKGRRVGGRAQAIALAVGKGRIVIAGEAAMFTVQENASEERTGLTEEDNQAFALGTMRWLSRSLD